MIDQVRRNLRHTVRFYDLDNLAPADLDEFCELAADWWPNCRGEPESCVSGEECERHLPLPLYADVRRFDYAMAALDTAAVSSIEGPYCRLAEHFSGASKSAGLARAASRAIGAGTLPQRCRLELAKNRRSVPLDYREHESVNLPAKPCT